MVQTCAAYEMSTQYSTETFNIQQCAIEILSF